MSTDTAGLGDDALHVLDLSLAAGEGTELENKVLAFAFCDYQRSWLSVRGMGLSSVVSELFQSMESDLNSRTQLDAEQFQTRKTYPLLSDLPGALVLSVPQEFNDTALIGSETDDFTGDVANESGAAGGLALGAADPVLGGVKGGGFL